MEKIINLGVLAHVDAGKTTVTEGLLVHCGAKTSMGRVDHGTTTTDSMTIEQQRGMTIRAATVSFTYKDTKINLIDTPGHMDFIAEVERSLSVLDGVVLVVSAREGVQPQTRVIFRKLRAMGIPTILFVNKIDRIGVSIEMVMRDVRDRLSPDVAVMQRVTGEGSREAVVLPVEAFDESVIERDDALVAAYFADEPISKAQYDQALWSQTRQGRCFPVFFGAALHDIGIEPLLEAIAACFGAEIAADGPLSGVIYKVEWEASGHKRLYVRLFSGVLAIRSRVPLVGSEEPVHIKGLLAARDGKFVSTEYIVAGDIGVIMDAPGVRCGDWIGAATERKGVMAAAPPLLMVGIAPETPAERPALLTALQRLAEEDPFLDLVIHPDTGEISIRLFGALQREIIEALLAERFGLRAVFSPLQTRFAEKPARKAAAEIRLWTEGNHHEAGIALTVEPLPAGSGNVYETQVSYGDLTRTFQNGVAEGIQMGLAEGLGQEIVDAKVCFVDMDYSSVTSTPADYRRLAPLVLQKALREAGIIRLEPWLTYSVIAPLEQQKRILSALMNIRATLDSVEYGMEELQVRGEVPLDTSKAFAVELLSMTQGKGTFETEFLEYRQI